MTQRIDSADDTSDLQGFKLLYREYGLTGARKFIGNISTMAFTLYEVNFEAFAMVYSTVGMSSGNTNSRSKEPGVKSYCDSVIEFEFAQMDLADFRLYDKQTKIPGGHVVRDLTGMEFESEPEFSQRYYLKTKDEPKIKAFFESGPVHFFAKNTGYFIEED